MLNSYSKHLPQMTEIYDVIGIMTISEDTSLDFMNGWQHKNDAAWLRIVQQDPSLVYQNYLLEL